MKKLYLYLISDSSGETVCSVAESSYTQFKDIEVIKQILPMIRSKEQINNIFQNITKIQKKETKQNTAILIIHTMINGQIREHLINKCVEQGLHQICPIHNVIREIANITNIEPSKNVPGKYQISDPRYFDKVKKINFAVTHDDGQGKLNADNPPDILILGVSRTSKSPTSFYLANRGYSVANAPIIPGHKYNYNHLTQTLIVGLTVSYERLSQIRMNRFNIQESQQQHYSYYKKDSLKEYSSLDNTREEITYAHQIFNLLKIPVIDITYKSVEEIAGEIVNLLATKNKS